MAEIGIDSVVEKYITLRNRVKEIEAKAKEDMAEIKEKLAKLEAWLLSRAEKMGVDSFKTSAGTAFLQSSDRAQVVSWEDTLKFIQDNDAWQFLDHRVNKTAVREWMEQNGTVPPGVDYNTIVNVRIRKSAGR